jgi:hypothetical protein
VETLSVADVLVSLVFVVSVLEESDVGVEETDELVCVGVELGEEDEGGVEVGVLEEDEESLVGVADVLAGVVDVLAALLGELDEVRSPNPAVTPDNTPERAESTCRLLKTFASSQFACVRANNTASNDSRCIWGRENIMMMVCVLIEKNDGRWRGKDEEMKSLFAPSYSRWVRLSVGFAETFWKEGRTVRGKRKAKLRFG